MNLPIKRILVFTVLVLGCADLLTTNKILELGFYEANPIMQAAQTWFGSWWAIPKLGATFIVMALIWHSKNVYNIALVAAFLSTPVINNLLLIAGAS